MSDALFSSRPGDFATARRGIDAEEVQFIRQRSAWGTSAFNIARMLGRPVQDVEAFCFRPEPKREPPAVPAFVVDDPYRPPSKPLVGSKRQPRQGMPSRAKQLVSGVAALHGLTADILIGERRTDAYCVARDQACWRLHRVGFSYSQIGRWMGGRDHTTIRSAVIRHSQRIQDQQEAWNE